MKILLMSAVVAICSISSGAMAGCVGSRYYFHVALSDTATAHMTTTGKCSHQWNAGGRTETVFTSASIIEAPHNGKLKQTGPLAFHYAANKGFKGSDAYSISVCGRGPAGSGCSKIIYDMSVE